jgi:hypothetical protein
MTTLSITSELGWVVDAGYDPAPVVQEAGWAPRPVWTDAENLASTGIRSPDRQARSESQAYISSTVDEASLSVN